MQALTRDCDVYKRSSVCGMIDLTGGTRSQSPVKVFVGWGQDVLVMWVTPPPAPHSISLPQTSWCLTAEALGYWNVFNPSLNVIKRPINVKMVGTELHHVFRRLSKLKNEQPKVRFKKYDWLLRGGSRNLRKVGAVPPVPFLSPHSLLFPSPSPAAPP